MSTKKTIYIIRHGETEYNKQGIIQGSGVDSSLNDLGRRQAEQFHKAYYHIAFDHIYTSQLRRTQESVAPFAAAGYSTEAIAEFNEIDWGIFEGKKSTPDSHKLYMAMINDWKAGLLDRSIEGGETPNQLQRRQRLGLAKIMAKPQEETILICMHGRAMRSFICLLTGTPLERMDIYKHNNLCLYVLEQKGSSFEIKEQNCSQHLWI